MYTNPHTFHTYERKKHAFTCWRKNNGKQTSYVTIELVDFVMKCRFHREKTCFFFAVLSWNTFEAFELLFSSHIFWSKWQIEIDSCCWAWCLFITDNTIKKEKKKKKKRESEKTNTLKYKWSTNVNNSHF